jgi:hypothetical protein
MGKFRKKPVVIEASVFTGGISFDEMTVDWGGDFAKVARYNARTNTLDIKTLEGVMEALLGDWIIKGIKGEFYPCKPDIFAATYEPAEDL